MCGCGDGYLVWAEVDFSTKQNTRPKTHDQKHTTQHAHHAFIIAFAFRPQFFSDFLAQRGYNSDSDSDITACILHSVY